MITDYTVGEDSIKISSGSITASSVKGSDVMLKVGTGYLTVKNGKGKKITVTDANGQTTSQVYDGTASTTLTLTNKSSASAKADSTIKKIDASSRTKSIKITGNTLANTIIGGSNADTIYAGAGTDSVNGGDGNDKLFGEAGNDTLIGGKGSDTLTGGAGNDVFFYASGDGNDVISDYTSGDKIKITGAKIKSTSVSGSDVILKVGSNSIRVKNAKGKELSIYNNSKSAINTVIGGSSSSSSNITLTDSDSSSQTLASGVKTVNSSSRTSAIKIIGNSNANSIVGGKGADTLAGGKGSDTLTGGKGKDIFVYASGDGNDIITDYTEKQDRIRITSGSISDVSFNDDDVIFKIGSGSITVKNGEGKQITIIDSSGDSTTEIYDDDYYGYDDDNYDDDDYRERNYVEKTWFTNEGDIQSSELDSIVDIKSDISSDYLPDYNSTFKSASNIDYTSLTSNSSIIQSKKK